MQSIFDDEKLGKQVINAAKRVSKKRTSSGADTASPTKKKARSSIDDGPPTPAQLEASLELPGSEMGAEELSKLVLVSNRAPLVLAFAVTLLKFTMPDQPISSRLSLAQAVVSINSRSKAVSLGLESGKSAEEEGFGQGQPFVKVMGKDIRVMKRWGYSWRQQEAPATDGEQQDAIEASIAQEEDEPALWALDLEALKKTSGSNATAHVHSNSASLPIYTPQSARSYIARAFDSPLDSVEKSGTSKKPSGAAVAAAKEINLGHLLKALDLLYRSWSSTIELSDLDHRSWSWYMAVRPSVADGVAGWGGKGTIKLADILDLRRKDDLKAL